MPWRFLPLLAALALASASAVGGGEMCGEVPGAPASEGLETTLFEWCCDDPACALAFQQSYRKNFTVFKHLVDPQLFAEGRSVPSLYGPARALLCEGHDDREIARRLWLLGLVANAGRHRPQCGMDHYPVFDAASLTTECVCKPDRSCSENTVDLVPFDVILALVLLLFVLFVVGTFYANNKALRAIDTVLSTRPGTRLGNARPGINALMRTLPRGTGRA